jgi:glutathione-regulated potassium-efflux system ancillary protein KefG
VLYFHPTQKTSRVGSALANAVRGLSNVTFRDMYGLYPDFLIDVKEEQRILEEHDLVVFQHPVYWYSCPPLLKLWIDEVFEHGWAYGTGGNKLHGKKLLSVVSAGGSAQAYSPSGSNRFEIRTFFSPFDQTAHLCGMMYAEPLVVHGARGLSDEQIAQACQRYVQTLRTYVESGELP